MWEPQGEGGTRGGLSAGSSNSEGECAGLSWVLAQEAEPTQQSASAPTESGDECIQTAGEERVDMWQWGDDGRCDQLGMSSCESSRVLDMHIFTT